MTKKLRGPLLSLRRIGVLAACLMFLCPAGVSGQQNGVVNGRVLDQNDQPVAGATIVVKGTTIGNISSADGTFSIRTTPENHILTVSFTGYQTAEVDVAGRNDVTVVLAEDTKLIDEVVIVAYGQQKKATVTGALASVSNDDLKKAPVSNFAAALTGRLPGLTIQQTTGMPGRENVNIYLRGISTMGDSSPLIMIDGVPRSDLSSLDTNEVENVTVLKDAASTAVFGVRGANGVILVTTRRGSEGKAEVSLTGEYSMQSMIYRPPKIDSWDYAGLINQRNLNSDIAPAFTQWQVDRFRSGEDPVFFPNRDPYSELIKSFAPQFKVNVNVSGGTKDTRYFVNASYLDQGSIFKTQDPAQLGYDPSMGLKRINFRANVDYNITKSLTASVNLSGYISRVKMIPWDDGMEWSDPDLSHNWITISVIPGINRTAPTNPGPVVPAGQFDSSGKPLPEGGWIAENYQYYARMNYAGYIEQTVSTLNTSAALEWKMDWLTKGLSAKAQVAYDLNASGWLKASRFYNAYTYKRATQEGESSYFEQREWNGNFHAEEALRFYPNGGRGQQSDYRINAQVMLNYARTFKDKHDVSAMLLAQRDNWVNPTGNSIMLLPYNMLYYSARATYVYDRRYIVELNMGANGSEQFARGKRFGFFPAVSAGWVISEEPFFKKAVETKWIDLLKLRASYGIVGNDKLGTNRFIYLDDMVMSAGGPIPTLGRGQYVRQGKIGNPDLTWERAGKQNYGLEIGFLRGFTFTFDYFREYRENILINRQTTPMFQGVASSNLPAVNMGIMQNHGYEMILNYSRIFPKGWRLFASANYSFARNKVLEYDEVKRPVGGRNYVHEYRTTGYSWGQGWGLQIDYDDGAGNGFINTESELEKYKTMYASGGYVPEAFLGGWKYKDLNGDRKIDDKDLVPLGYSGFVPEITYGATLSVGWKNIDLSILVQGVARKSSALVIGQENDGFFAGDWQLQAWTKERFEKGEPITYRALTTRAFMSEEMSDFVVSDLSYFRLKNVELGYTLGPKASAKIGMKALRIYVSGQNLLTVSHLKAKIVDPEVGHSGSYPITRNINFGLNLTF